MIKNVKFITSVFDKSKLIKTTKKQIVLVGKSNVGKSSFINAICNNSKLAKIGSSPGKTRSINYYLVNDEYYLVDLPGYGYSKMSIKEKENVAKLVDKYLESGNVSYIFFLVDIRHKPTLDDKTMQDYLSSYDIPFTIIANKADKISKKAQQENIDIIRKVLFAKEEILPFSAEKKENVDAVIDIIENLI
ncbi:MAG: YihA family ribosome biogenesis GTP-binding protein [Clostridia bacterium]|nr:YihA family ribosome biogenesis GTP-binding protein [Clostridia bacterium]